MYLAANSACWRQRTTSWNSGFSRSFVAIRIVVTGMPDPVVRNSGVATTRPTRVTRLTDVPFAERLVSVVSAVVLVLRLLVLVAMGCTSCLVDRCSGVIQTGAERNTPRRRRLVLG